MKIEKIFNTKYGGLIFSLLSGFAYFIVILSFILGTDDKAGLLGFFFAPAIICGMALVLFKMIRQFLENEEFKKANIVGILHVILMLISVIFLMAMILR
ncbi:MAG: hypothetical protein IJ304_05280 [Clostridia bacterium]|nr:hypothetical protein [Clostridia bacterium]